MKFSICIPNYNYEKYLGGTLNSVLRNRFSEIEILITDNASTDGSVSLIKQFQSEHSGITLHINSTNLGFSANLDKAASLATGDYMIMLSSDDLVGENAFSTYAEVIKQFPNAIISSSVDIIDSDDTVIGYTGPDKRLWEESTDIDHDLSARMACTVYRLKANELLKRCYSAMANPFNFCTVAYPQNMYELSGGYTSRLINPDKWFHWKILAQAEDVIYIDKALFQYRWHNQNQMALQARSGHLKYMVDEYRNTIEVVEPMLKKAGFSADDFQQSFIKNDVHKHGLAEFLKGRWLKSLRIYFFGLSTYPAKMIFTIYFLPYTLLLLSTPIGSFLISKIMKLEK